MVATTVTAPIEETCHSLEGIAQYIRAHESDCGKCAIWRRKFWEFIWKVRSSILSGAGVHPAESILAAFGSDV